MNYWSHYWKNKTVEDLASLIAEGHADDLMNHLAGEMFRKRGVSSGDVIYAVTQAKGDIYLIGRLVVDVVTAQAQAEQLLGNTDLWEASEHVIARKPWTPCRFDLQVPHDVLSEVKFVTPKGEVVGLKYNKYGTVDQQTLRTLRELTDQTAALFDSLL
jgi:hypothetical protein